MDEFEVVIDFSGDGASGEEKARLIKAVNEGKKFKTKMTYFGDGDYNAFYINELSMVFNTTTLVQLAQEMGFEMKNEDYTDEEIKELTDDLNENGYDDGYNTYLEESKDDFLD
jgi:hypothetical protein